MEKTDTKMDIPFGKLIRVLLLFSLLNFDIFSLLLVTFFLFIILPFLSCCLCFSSFLLWIFLVVVFRWLLYTHLIFLYFLSAGAHLFFFSCSISICMSTSFLSFLSDSSHSFLGKNGNNANYYCKKLIKNIDKFGEANNVSNIQK